MVGPDPLRSRKERAQVVGDVEGIGKKKWWKEQSPKRMGRDGVQSMVGQPGIGTNVHHLP